MMRLTRRAALASGFALAAQPALGGMFDPSPAEQDRFIEALKTPGHALLLRHALAPGHNDPGDFRLDACQTQRNLNDVGRNQAVRIGEWLRARNIIPSTIYSSQWCRCLDTAKLLALGEVVPEVALNSISDMSGTDGAKMARLRRFIADTAAKPGPALFVTHSNVSSRLIGGLLGSGEGAVLKIGMDGSSAMVGRVLFGMARM